jgi:polyhydroxybutyrate depolymerase
MKRTLLFLFLISAFLDFSAQTTIDDSIYVGGMYRQYRLYVPAIYNGATSVPLILNLHGYGSNNLQQEAYGDFRPIADTANFIIVHPNGTYDGNNNRYWNCWLPVGSSPNDVNFLSALIDSVDAAYNIDLQRVYSTGLSNGGFMSSELACFLSTRITAIASVGAGMGSVHNSQCNPSHPTPFMEIHGTADAVVPYNGGTGMMHVDSVIKFWVEFNNCNTSAIQTSVTNINSFDGCTADNFLYSNGNAGATVELYKVYNGGHTWPGAIPVPGLGNTCQDFSASKEIWRFFRDYSLNNLVGIKDNGLQIKLNIYPNPVNEILYIDAGYRIENICITDISGREIFQEKFSDSRAEINCRDLNSGIYVMTIFLDGRYVRKIFTK